SNWVVGDSLGSPPFAYAARQPDRSWIGGFDNPVPDQDAINPGRFVAGVRRSADASFDGPLTFAVIQTLYTGEPKPQGPEPDVVMLARMPLQYPNAQGGRVTVLPNTGSYVAVVRNPQWLQHPDIGQAQGKGWTVLADNVPPATFGILVGGGHQKPV